MITQQQDKYQGNRDFVGRGIVISFLVAFVGVIVMLYILKFMNYYNIIKV